MRCSIRIAAAPRTTSLPRSKARGVFERVANLQSASEIADGHQPKQALIVMHIRQTSSGDSWPGESVVVQVIADGRNSNTAGTAAGYVRSRDREFQRALARRSRRRRSVAAHAREPRAWYNPNLETRWNMIPSLIAALSMLQTLMLTALSVAREREQGTFDQLLVTPLRPSEIMVGKAVPSILIGLSQSTLILLISLFWFRIPLAGSLITLFTALTLFTIAAVGIGLAISAYSANMQQAMLYTFVLLMPMMLLSGLTSPIRTCPRSCRP